MKSCPLSRLDIWRRVSANNLVVGPERHANKLKIISRKEAFDDRRRFQQNQKNGETQHHINRLANPALLEKDLTSRYSCFFQHTPAHSAARHILHQEEDDDERGEHSSSPISSPHRFLCVCL